MYECGVFFIHFDWCCTLFKVASGYRCFSIDTNTHTHSSIIHPNTNEYVVWSQWRSSLLPHRFVCVCVGAVFTAITLVRDVSGEMFHKKAHTASKHHDFSFNFATHITFRKDVRGSCSGSFHGACASPLDLPHFAVMRNRSVIRVRWVAHETKNYYMLSELTRLHPILVWMTRATATQKHLRISQQSLRHILYCSVWSHRAVDGENAN